MPTLHDSTCIMANKTTHHSPLALTYAQSLLDLASERNDAVEVGKELEGLREILEAQPMFREYLIDPGISNEECAEAVKRIFRGRVSELVYNFLGVLNSHGRMKFLEPMIESYADLLEEKLGNVEVDVTTAQKLGPEELEQVRQRVSQTIGKNAVIHQYVDDAIIGGLVIRVGDRIIDASVKQQLASMREKLLAGSQHRHG